MEKKNKGAIDEIPEVVVTRYDLRPNEIELLESEILEAAKNIKPNGMVCAWIAPRHKFSNLLRTYEAQKFPEVTQLPDDIEDRSLFLALIDTRRGVERVVHSTTISGLIGRKAGELLDQDGNPHETSGFIVIDDLVEMGNFTNEEFWQYYSSRGVDLSNSMSVETNFRVGERVDKLDGLSSSDIAYLCLFRLLKSRSKNLSKSVVFASINGDSIHSFERVGIRCEPLMGRTDLRTSESQQGLEFKPVAIPSNAEIFDYIDLDVPQLTFGVEI